jgi:hypothetical protein
LGGQPAFGGSARSARGRAPISGDR